MTTPIEHFFSFLNKKMVPFLDVASLQNYILVCKAAHDCLRIDATWRQICLENWPVIDSSLQPVDGWQQVYDNIYSCVEQEVFFLKERVQRYNVLYSAFFESHKDIKVRSSRFPRFPATLQQWLLHYFDEAPFCKRQDVRCNCSLRRELQFSTLMTSTCNCTCCSSRNNSIKYCECKKNKHAPSIIFSTSDIDVFIPSFEVQRSLAQRISVHLKRIFNPSNIWVQLIEIKQYSLFDQNLLWQGEVRFSMIGADAQFHTFHAHFEADSFFKNGLYNLVINKSPCEVKNFLPQQDSLALYGASVEYAAHQESLFNKVKTLLGSEQLFLAMFAKQKNKARAIMLFWLKTIPYNVLEKYLFPMRSLIVEQRSDLLF